VRDEVEAQLAEFLAGEANLKTTPEASPAVPKLITPLSRPKFAKTDRRGDGFTCLRKNLLEDIPRFLSPRDRVFAVSLVTTDWYLQWILLARC